jgi:hypothetical protein
MKTNKLFLIYLFLLLPLTLLAQSGKKTNIENLRLKITVGEKTVLAEFIDSKTTRDFISLLPLELTMDDLNEREKYSYLPKELSKEGNVTTSFQEGDLSYWLGGGLAAFYNDDKHQVKAGLIVMARLGKDIKLFKVPGAVKVRFEAVKK